MSLVANNLGNSSKWEENSANTCDKECGSNSNAECQSFEIPRTINSRMSQKDNRSYVPSILGPRPPCLQFRRWGSCSYGDNCRYAHIAASVYGPSQGIGVEERNVGNRNIEVGKDSHRESSAITIATSGRQMRNRTHSGTPEPRRAVDFRTKFLKTRICNKWKTTGSCSYDSACNFAHGEAELQSHGFSNPLESSSSAGISAPANAAPDGTGSSAPPERRLRFNCTDMRKISQVYADWPDFS